VKTGQRISTTDPAAKLYGGPGAVGSAILVDGATPGEGYVMLEEEIGEHRIVVVDGLSEVLNSKVAIRRTNTRQNPVRLIVK
jgi:hypothetical protein